MLITDQGVQVPQFCTIFTSSNIDWFRSCFVQLRCKYRTLRLDLLGLLSAADKDIKNTQCFDLSRYFSVVSKFKFPALALKHS